MHSLSQPLPGALQVVYWEALKKAQEGELSSQTEVFGGEQGQHRLRDFKCVPAVL